MFRTSHIYLIIKYNKSKHCKINSILLFVVVSTFLYNLLPIENADDLLCHGFLALGKGCLDRFAGKESIEPLFVMWKFLVHLFIVFLIIHHRSKHVHPRNKGQISVGAFITRQKCLARTFEVTIQNSAYALDFIDVSFFGRRNGFTMVIAEPHRLAKVGSLSRGLKVQPLVGCVIIHHVRCWVRNFVFLVVRVDQVGDNGSRLPKSNASVRIMNGGDSAIGINIRERGL